MVVLPIADQIEAGEPVRVDDDGLAVVQCTYGDTLISASGLSTAPRDICRPTAEITDTRRTSPRAAPAVSDDAAHVTFADLDSVPERWPSHCFRAVLERDCCGIKGGKRVCSRPRALPLCGAGRILASARRRCVNHWRHERSIWPLCRSFRAGRGRISAQGDRGFRWDRTRQADRASRRRPPEQGRRRAPDRPAVVRRAARAGDLRHNQFRHRACASGPRQGAQPHRHL